MHYDSQAYLGTPPDDEILYHCVWGNYGKANGYFRITSDGICGNRYKSGEGDGVFDGHTDSQEFHMFDKKLNFKQDIKPNSYN